MVTTLHIFLSLNSQIHVFCVEVLADTQLLCLLSVEFRGIIHGVPPFL